jgi:glycosyltransferase involved in cell wall biosynthesis
MVKVLFFSPVKDIKLFDYTGFYRMDRLAMESLGWEITFTNNLYDVVHSKNYDILYTYFWTHSAFALIIARVLGKRTIATGGADSLDRLYNTNILDYVIKSTLFAISFVFSDAVLVVSNKDMVNMRKIVGKRKKLIFSMHPVELNESEISVRAPHIATVAWMVPISNVKRKGVDRLIHVFNELKKIEGYEMYRLRILGTKGPGSEYLETIVNDIGVEGIDFVGVVTEEEKQRELNTARFYGQLSEYEGFGLAALEALAAGCVVVHSGRGGLQDAIGGLGIQVDLKNSDADIAAQIADWQTHHRLNQTALDDHLAQFAIAKRAQKILSAARRNYESAS